MPELTFPKEEELEPKPTVAAVAPPSRPKVNGELDHADGGGGSGDEAARDDVESETSKSVGGGSSHDETYERSLSPAKSRGVPAAKVFGDAKPVDTAAKEREIEERLKQRELEAKQKAEDERNRKADDGSGSVTGSSDAAPEKALSEAGSTQESQEPAAPIQASALRREDSNSWRNRSDDDNRPRRHYSPERDSRGPPRRNGEFLSF